VSPEADSSDTLPATGEEIPAPIYQLMPAHYVPPEPLRRFTLRSILIVTAALAFTWGMTAHQIRQSRVRLRQTYARAELPNCLARVNYGLRAYGGRHTFLQRVFGSSNPWPPVMPVDAAGRPFLSWRVLPATYYHQSPQTPKPDLSAPWNSVQNRTFAAARGNPYNINYRGVAPSTQFFAITGPGTAFDGGAVSHYADLPPNVIVVMEVADSKIHWMQLGDYDVTKLLAATGRLGDTITGLLPDRIHILFANGEVWALSPDTPIDALKPLLTITAAKAASRDESLSPYRVD
jgi:hypothetical protein